MRPVSFFMHQSSLAYFINDENSYIEISQKIFFFKSENVIVTYLCKHDYQSGQRWFVSLAISTNILLLQSIYVNLAMSKNPMLTSTLWNWLQFTFCHVFAVKWPCWVTLAQLLQKTCSWSSGTGICRYRVRNDIVWLVRYRDRNG